MPVSGSCEARTCSSVSECKTFFPRNVEIGLKYGLSTFDSAVGGLGGCPYAPGAKGNLNTRSLIEAFGINNFSEDLDLDKIKFAEKHIGKINQY